jgi:asparagine synthase (glutamine-hydrolysing)
VCGLAGIARIGTDADFSAQDGLLQRMTRAVSHRGPDETVERFFGPVTLGFTRLSLVDPSGGGQPLMTSDESLVLIANGEIYNHRELAASLPRGVRLRTGSDCEVLLHLYRRDGQRFLDQVRGMFAIVLWDRVNHKLLFARDRFGIKPLFYHQDDERILFASEIKALFEDNRTPRALDWERALGDQMLSSAATFDISPAHSWFRGIELVPASTIVTFDLATGARHEHRYWEFPSYAGCGDASESELVRAYAETLAASVTECGMADVEVGLFLSGGIDSAAVAGLSSTAPRTFTALNASTYLNGDAEYGHRIARHLGLVNHQVLLDAAQVPTAEEWKRHLWLLEAPVAGPESYYKYEMYRYVRRHAPEIKAMLLGVGSDEFNGGYSGALAFDGGWEDFLAAIRQMALRSALERRPDLGAWWELPGAPLLNTEALRELAGTSDTDAFSMYHRWKYRCVQQYNCWHEDRTAAGSGIEARVPFLDHRLIEIAAAIPAALRPGLVWNKGILRRALADVLPEEFTERPKVPFFYGEGTRYTYRTFARMLAQDGASLVEEALSTQGAKQFLDAGNVRATLHALEADPSSGALEFLLQVVNLGLLEQMSAALPTPPTAQRELPTPQSVVVHDWEGQRRQLEARVLRRRPPARGDVLALPEEALLLQDAGDPRTWYLAVRGQIEFIVTDDEGPGWASFLRALDGSRDIASALVAAGASYEALADLISESVDEGSLRVLQTVQGRDPS